MSERERTLRFTFDYISSNAYLVWKRLPDLARRYDLAIEAVPVLFAGFLEAYGQLGPAEIVPKAIWMAKNNLRKAALLGIPLEPPVHHPFNPLLALRASSLDVDGDRRGALISALFDAVWVSGLHVSESEVVARLAREVGLDGAATVAGAQSDAAKARLREQTDAAIARGVFGVPSMEIDDDLFWGYDDLPYLELKLAGRDPLDPNEYSKWMRKPSPSAMRKRMQQSQEVPDGQARARGEEEKE